MCLYINKYRHYKGTKVLGRAREIPHPFIADRPLVIQKRVKLVYFGPDYTLYESPYRKTKIELGVQLETDLDVKVCDYSTSVTVERGFHGYLFDANAAIAWGDRPTLMTNNVKTIYGVIPPGAEYYIGADSEIVSNKVIYFKSINDILTHYGVSELSKPVKGDYAKG